MLVAVLKGHTSRVIGCDFLGAGNLLSVDEAGVLNVFNFKVPHPVASQMINKARFKEVAFFTNKQQFALLSTDNRIFIVQVQNVGRVTAGEPQVRVRGHQGVHPLGLPVQLEPGHLPRQRQHPAGLLRGPRDPHDLHQERRDPQLDDRHFAAHRLLRDRYLCRSPVTPACLDQNPNIYLMTLEAQGFKMADVDESQLRYVVPAGFTDFLFKKEGNHSWQILDSLQKEKVYFITINHHSKNPNLIAWSLSNKN